MATALQTSLFAGATPAPTHSTLAADEIALVDVLDHAATLFDRLDISGMPAVIEQLNIFRLTHGVRAWQSAIERVVAPHRVRALLHEDPLTGHAFAKPRGYPGDAALLDLIYRDTSHPVDPTPLGARIHEFTPSQHSCRSVCERRELLAALIDRIAAERPMPRILSLACGHLREAQRSQAVRDGKIGEIVAVDQDPLSLAAISREANGAAITPVKASIRRFLVDPTVYGDFDLIYSAGLYDYLEDETAKRLTTSMFAALRPGGTLVIANFAPELPEIGYMEAIMDWRLIYRNEHQVAAFCDGIHAYEIREQRMQRDSGGHVIYLTVQKC